MILIRSAWLLLLVTAVVARADDPEGGGCGGHGLAPCCDTCCADDDCIVLGECVFCPYPCNCQCDAGLVEIAGFCYPPPPCGGGGEICCEPGCVCDDAWSQQYFGVCGPCGGSGQAYCLDGNPGQCQPGLVNLAGICTAPPCGGGGEICCEPGCVCDDAWSQQYLGFCGPCGGSGQAYCLDGNPGQCQPGLANFAGICAPCDPCNPACSAFDACLCFGADPCACDACDESCDPACNPLCGAFDLGVCVAGQLGNCPPPPLPTVTTVFVTPGGSLAPDGSNAAPYALIESAACKAAPGQTVLAAAGNYRETMTIDKSVTLTATGGTVTIGTVQGVASTTLRVMTYNTHLFGAEFEIPVPPPFPPVSVQAFADPQRAQLLGQRIKDEDVDVVGLDEVWDVDLANVIIAAAEYPHSYYVDDFDEDTDILNSGLLLLSKFPLSGTTLSYYPDAFAEDVFASKGFMQATVTKDGFEFGIFLTHMQATQSYAPAGAYNVRQGQFQQLDAAVDAYQSAHPAAAVIVMGDFNVIGESCEYYDQMLAILSRTDAHRAAPCFAPDQYTYDPAQNDLIEVFADATQGERLDYVLFSGGAGQQMLPVHAEVKMYQSSPPISYEGDTAADLSDHFGLRVDFEVLD